MSIDRDKLVEYLNTPGKLIVENLLRKIQDGEFDCEAVKSVCNGCGLIKNNKHHPDCQIENMKEVMELKEIEK